MCTCLFRLLRVRGSNEEAFASNGDTFLSSPEASLSKGQFLLSLTLPLEESLPFLLSCTSPPVPVTGLGGSRSAPLSWLLWVLCHCL